MDRDLLAVVTAALDVILVDSETNVMAGLRVVGVAEGAGPSRRAKLIDGARLTAFIAHGKEGSSDT
jgi:hypothetical protein